MHKKTARIACLVFLQAVCAGAAFISSHNADLEKWSLLTGQVITFANKIQFARGKFHLSIVLHLGDILKMLTSYQFFSETYLDLGTLALSLTHSCTQDH
jgi:hypothetical protein